MNEIPRRARIDKFTPAEKAIYDAVQIVEEMGADVLLTDAVILLQQARDKVADFVDRPKNTIMITRTVEDGTKHGKRECVEMTEEELKAIYPELYEQIIQQNITK